MPRLSRTRQPSQPQRETCVAVSGLGPDAPWRKVLARGKGKLLSSYIHLIDNQEGNTRDPAGLHVQPERGRSIPQQVDPCVLFLPRGGKREDGGLRGKTWRVLPDRLQEKAALDLSLHVRRLYGRGKNSTHGKQESQVFHCPHCIKHHEVPQPTPCTPPRVLATIADMDDSSVPLPSMRWVPWN